MNDNSDYFITTEQLDGVIRLAGEAGEKILSIYNTDFEVENKNDKSPLTEADMLSHQTIFDGLSKLIPDFPILSEESADIPYSKRGKWDRYWLVDPLDGTREFIKRNGEFTVNIALIDNHRPVLGVVYVPVTQLCYYAVRGRGAFKQESNQPALRIRSKKTEGRNFTVAGSRSHGSEQQTKFFDSLGADTELIAIGSSLKFCLVAEGRVDIYPRFGPTSEWDTAAAQCIVEESGGVVVNTQYKTLLYNTRESVLNPSFLVIADKSFDWKPYLSGLESIAGSD